MRFASINVNVHDADRLGATGIVGDAKRALAALAEASPTGVRHVRPPGGLGPRSSPRPGASSGADALDPDQLFDKSAVPADSDVVTTTDAVLTQGQIIGVLQEHARAGDVIVAAAGGPPGDLQKVWDATDGRTCHLEFGFSCMGYEIPAAMGVRLAHPDPAARITAFLGDGTFLMAPTELVTAAQEGLADHPGDPGEPRLPGDPPAADVPQRPRVRQRVPLPHHGRWSWPTPPRSDKAARLDGDYLAVDLVQVAAGLGARGVARRTPPTSCAPRWTRPAATRARSSSSSRRSRTPTCPAAGVWWDVAPAEVSEVATVPPLRAEYEPDRKTQRWFG